MKLAKNTKEIDNCVPIYVIFWQIIPGDTRELCQHTLVSLINVNHKILV